MLTTTHVYNAALVLLVSIEQVWGKGRFEGRQSQFVEITVEDDRVILVKPAEQGAQPGEERAQVRARGPRRGSLADSYQRLVVRVAQAVGGVVRQMRAEDGSERSRAYDGKSHTGRTRRLTSSDTSRTTRGCCPPSR